MLTASSAAVLYTVITLLTLFSSIHSLWATPPAHYVAAGGSHTCAMTEIPIGGVKCWGNNLNGQLGDGTKTERSIPTQVQNLTSGVSSVVAGESHTCALMAADGSVRCWGANTIGQLGDVTGVDQTTPVNVLKSLGTPLTGVVSITAGGSHTCAALSDGTALCWGRNIYGQLGVGSSFNYTNTPSLVSATNISQISAGGNHTCLVRSNTHEIKCAGYNLFGQLGDTTTSSSNSPVAVSGITTAIEVASGLYHSCGILSNAKLYCWGRDDYGQLGDNAASSYSVVPVAVHNLGNNVTEVTAGGTFHGHTCAIHGLNNDLSCWGKGDAGQLGDSLGADANIPSAVIGVLGAIDVSAGGTHTCAVDSSCNVMCWGANGNHQIGDGSSVSNRLSPVTAMTCIQAAPTATPTATPTALPDVDPTLTPTPTFTPTFTPTPEACSSESSCTPDPSLTSALNPRSPAFTVTTGSTVRIDIVPLRAAIPTDETLREALRKKLAKFFKIKVPDIAKVLKAMRVFYNVDIRPVARGTSQYLGAFANGSSTRLRLETRKTRVTGRFAPGTYVANVTIKLRDAKGRLFSSSAPGAGTQFTVR